MTKTGTRKCTKSGARLDTRAPTQVDFQRETTGVTLLSNL